MPNKLHLDLYAGVFGLVSFQMSTCSAVVCPARYGRRSALVRFYLLCKIGFFFSDSDTLRLDMCNAGYDLY